MAFYQNKQTIRDGRILLYQRTDTKEPIWYARMKVKGHSGYIVKSLHTQSLAEATETAEDHYDQLRYRVKLGLSLKEATWGDVFKEYNKLLEYRLNANDISKQRVRQINALWRSQMQEFWSDRKCASTTQHTVDEFWQDRIANGNVTPDTLYIVKGILNQLLKLAVKQQYILTMFDTKPPVKMTKNRRGAFTLEQWDNICKTLPQWTKEGSNARNTYLRQMFRHFAQVNVQSGLRVGEMYSLKWKDIEYKSDYVALHVSGKTGKRTVVAPKLVEKYLKRWRKKTPHKEYVFCSYEGRKLGEYGIRNQFNMFIHGVMGYKEDSLGNKLSPYSFRHTYATFKIKYADVSLYDIAMNMGTSIKMIEEHYGHVLAEDKAAQLTKKYKPTLTTFGVKV